MNASPAAPRDACEWHSLIAERFDERYRRSPAFRERLELWSGLIGRYARHDADVLDAGCGSGVMSFVAARTARNVTAFDASLEMIRLAREKQAHSPDAENISFAYMRMEELHELSDKQFGLVMASSVLEYVADFWTTVDALAATLAPGGTLLFSVQNGASLYRRAERAAYSATGRPRYLAFVKSRPSEREITKGLRSRRLALVEKHYYAPAPVLSRVARAAGVPWLADNLIVFACRAPAEERQ